MGELVVTQFMQFPSFASFASFVSFQWWGHGTALAPRRAEGAPMTWKDKLEIGLKDDAAFRRDNLPEFQKSEHGRDKKAGDDTRSREEPGARREAARQAGPAEVNPSRRPARASSETMALPTSALPPEATAAPTPLRE